MRYINLRFYLLTYRKMRASEFNKTKWSTPVRHKLLPVVPRHRDRTKSQFQPTYGNDKLIFDVNAYRARREVGLLTAPSFSGVGRGPNRPCTECFWLEI